MWVSGVVAFVTPAVIGGVASCAADKDNGGQEWLFEWICIDNDKYRAVMEYLGEPDEEPNDGDLTLKAATKAFLSVTFVGLMMPVALVWNGIRKVCEMCKSNPQDLQASRNVEALNNGLKDMNDRLRQGCGAAVPDHLEAQFLE